MATATHRLLTDEGWTGASAMASVNGMLYLVHGETLYEIDPEGRSYRKASEEAWSTRFMVAEGGFLYTIEGDGGLYRVRVEDASYERINGDDWSSTRLVAVLDGKLWVADTSDVFYEVDLASGAWREPPKDGTEGSLAYDASGLTLLAGLGGMLYGYGGEAQEAGSRGISALLWRDGSAGGIHMGDFPEGRALVACAGRLYLNDGGGNFYAFPIPDKSKGQYTSSWEAVTMEPAAGRWDSVLATSTNRKIYTLDASGGLYEIAPRA